jgi:putative DNA methylase
MTTDRATSQADFRLIEDYIPIEAISNEAQREKSIRRGHISTLHLWWARRPLVAARAAVYGALVPAPTDKKTAKAAADFVADLCTYPGPRDTIRQAQKNILQAHAERLTQEQGQVVTVEDIEAGRAPRPRVLDMFAGGGAIPLEALRLGCEAYALDLNPVAHLIQLCTLVYPQQYGAPDPAAVGSGEGGSWAGLAAEVEHWGKWVLEKVRAEIGDLYPPIPDPASDQQPQTTAQYSFELTVPTVGGQPLSAVGFLTPVAYLWTRTVACKNPACGGTVPLARQTWLAKSGRRVVALRPDAEVNHHKAPGEKKVQYRVVEATTEKGLGFDPAGGSRGGNVACPFCGTVVDSSYVKVEGQAGRIGTQPMVVVCTQSEQQGKVYLAADQVPHVNWPDDEIIWQRIRALEKETGAYPSGSLTVPDESLPLVDARGAFFVKLYGFEKWSQLFIPRQLLALLTFAKYVRTTATKMSKVGYDESRAKAVMTYLGLWTDRIVDYSSGQCTWKPDGEFIASSFGRQALPMIWDFAEVNALGNASGNAYSALDWIIEVLNVINNIGPVAKVQRSSATEMSFEANIFDAVITDPPYYDNVPYSDLSDFFYVWLKQSIGFLYPEHFSSLLTPKKKEAIMDAGRHNRDKDAAKDFYEQMMAQAFAEASRVLKPNAPLVIVYAHKTTLGWSTLVDALRTAGFTVTEAWPLDTERPGRVRELDSAALASSIFLVARRRESNATGSYEQEVQPDLQRIVRERLERLWAQGVTGADLVIACVGAGMRAFTRFARVEYANGAPVPADSFLAEVEGAVLEALLEKIFGVSSVGVSSVDAVTRFYVLWRYAYRQATIDAGEAIVFALPQHVELDGPNSLSSGRNPLVEKQSGKFRLRDFLERGADEELGKPSLAGPAPLIDILHRILWLIEYRPSSQLAGYLDEVQPNVERLRVIAQTLAGQTLAGNGDGGGRSLVASKGAEAAALRKLTTNWRNLIQENLFRKG